MKRGLLAKGGMLGILTTPYGDQLILNQLFFYFTICPGSEQKLKLPPYIFGSFSGPKRLTSEARQCGMGWCSNQSNHNQFAHSQSEQQELSRGQISLACVPLCSATVVSLTEFRFISVAFLSGTVISVSISDWPSGALSLVLPCGDVGLALQRWTVGQRMQGDREAARVRERGKSNPKSSGVVFMLRACSLDDGEQC